MWTQLSGGAASAPVGPECGGAVGRMCVWLDVEAGVAWGVAACVGRAGGRVGPRSGNGNMRGNEELILI